MKSSVQNDHAMKSIPREPTTDAETRVADRLAEIIRHSPSRAALFRSVYCGRPSKAQAVKAKCLDCACWQTKEITECRSVTCPLWRVRPYQNAPRCQTQGRGKRFCEGTDAGKVGIAKVA
jgi:hypothetical protein